MKPLILSNHRKYLLLIFSCFSGACLHAQNTLTVISSGQTGTSGTNWSISGNTLTVSGGAAAIQSSVITTHLSNTGSLTIAASGAITIDQSLAVTLSAARSLTFKSNADITVSDARTITVAGNSLSTVFWADADGTGGGMIHCKPGSGITTNGGHVWMGGGAGSLTWNSLSVGNGFARSKTVLSSTQIQQLNNQSQDYQNAITLDRATISSAGGDIYMAGEASGESSAYSHIGILVQRGSSILSGSGSIVLSGKSASIRNASGWFWGILVASDRASEPNLIQSTSGAISTTGEASTTYNFNHSGGIGIFEWQVTTWGVNEIRSASGAITIDGNNKNASNASYGGLVFSGGSTDTRRVYNQTGDITLIGRSTNAATNGIAISGGIKVGYDGASPCSGKITLRTNRLGVLPAAARFQSTGELAVEPLTGSTTIGIAGGTGTLSLAAAYFSTYFVDGFSKLTIGCGTQTGNISIAAVSFNDEVTLQTSGTVSQTGAISAAGQQLNLLGGTFALTNTGNNVAKLLGNATALSYINNAALEVTSLTCTGAINVQVPAGSLTIAGNISSQSTGATAVVLAAGSGSSAGTISGGNLIVSGSPSLTAGSGGGIRLYSGNFAPGDGLYDLAGNNVSNLRFNTDINTSAFTPALSSGVNILYRENGAVWRGTTNDYNTGANWRDAAVPASGANIMIDPAATADLVLDAARTIGYLNFNGSNRKLILGNYDLTMNGELLNADADNYVRTNGSGRLRRSVANAASFIFHVGNSAYNPVTLTNHTGAADEFRVRVLDEVYANGYSGAAVSEKRVRRTWDIAKTNANAGSGIDFIFNWNSDEVSAPLATTALFHYGTGWQKQTGSTSFTSNSLTYTGYAGSFSPFAIGDAGVVLPVTWISFEGRVQEPAIVLEWRTAIEEQAGHYQVQHSSDAQQWLTLGNVQAYGNSRMENRYSYIHTEPSAGINYYRLKQVDINGTSSFSKTITVDYRTKGPEILYVYPNPVVGSSLNIILQKAGLVQLIHSSGKVIFAKQMQVGLNVVSIPTVIKGVYLLKAASVAKTLVIQ
jgi:hypothetical protein